MSAYVWPFFSMAGVLTRARKLKLAATWEPTIPVAAGFNLRERERMSTHVWTFFSMAGVLTRARKLKLATTGGTSVANRRCGFFFHGFFSR
jgi:hypothetical protein